MKCTPLGKRIALSSLLGTIFGLLCFFGFTTNPDVPQEMLAYTSWSLNNPMMWTIILNRFAIGFAVGIAGFITVHPMFGFRMYPFLRGFGIGVIISLSFAAGAMVGQDSAIATQTFWILIIAGGIIGMIIDLVATKVAGEGKAIMN